MNRAEAQTITHYPEAVSSNGYHEGLTRVSEVVAERVSWLWQGRLPRGKLVMLDGDPAVAKSTLSLDWAARVTTGSPWPDGTTPEAGRVVLMNAEDGIADTTRPRLEAAGADLSRVVVWETVHTVDDDGKPHARPPRIPDDLLTLEKIVTEEKASLVIVDVLNAFLSSRVNGYVDQDVRGALAPLARLAERTGACVVLIRHLSKSGGQNALYRGGGSIGIIGAARAAMLVALDPDDETRRILAMTKSNLAAFAPSLAFRVLNDEEHGCGRIAWDGTTAHSAADLLAVRTEYDDGADDACAALAAILSEPGDHWVKQCQERMREAGFSKDQARRAKDKIARSVKVGKPGDAVSGWQWVLKVPTEDGTEDGEDGSTQNPATFATFVPPSHTPTETAQDHERARGRTTDAAFDYDSEAF